MASSSIFFVKLPTLNQLCHVVLKVVDAQLDFYLQVLKCRQLLSICPHAVASPQIADKTLIDVVVHVDFYKKKFGQFCLKLNLKPIQASIAKSLVVEHCVAFTIKYKLSPCWNQVGNILVSNSDFLACHGKLEAVNFDITVRNEEMTINVKPHHVRLPPPKLENFGICPQALKRFHENSDYDIPETAINLQWCHILPSMKKGQLVNVSRKMPPSAGSNNMLKDYEGLRKYWKQQYGYHLPETADDMIFCSVYFLQLSSNLYTYPLICLRNQPVQFMPRCDGPEITKKFFYYLRKNFDRLCGLPLTYAGKACSTLNNLSIASKLHPDRPQNVRITDLDIHAIATDDKQSRQVPNNNVIPATQVLQMKTVYNQKVPASISDNDCEKRTFVLADLPTNSRGKYVPVFGSKKRAVLEKKTSQLTTCAQQIVASVSTISEKQRVLQKKELSRTKRENSEKGVSRASSKKHKFDQFFSSASSFSQISTPSKTFRAPLLTKNVCSSKKTCQFDSLFKPASKS